MTPEQEAIAAGQGDLLFEIQRLGPAGSRHGHALRVMSILWPDGETVWIEVSEPGGCGCCRRMTLGELAHVLINAVDADLRQIEDREVCPLGHSHHGENREP